ncbi:TrbG/VirB9 family P-type conjugative transfer protein [Asticcacaulis sp. AND118]|uniref:TrbG/VirB9 family P-type conjugative transfer protein n=1 Tax=Asticcacaulis sp. AND118 TaxID=2840468 RepID=UPI001CFF88D5|nr:TrbG/VirB9 family P-type conjugative transfer protein [Asticcacaulis sp. AND118]UDF05243.1 TrbG/VirB9 family P-type conjugative transfer protein [Asticcacaulis sp. AND118]
MTFASSLSLLIAVPLLAAAPVMAQDSRIRTLTYADGEVVRLDTCVSFQTMITFADSEKIENVALGDATQWQATPNKRGNLIFIKPFQRGAFTNMSVVTSRRTYAFELRTKDAAACKRGEVIYDLRFTYPQDEEEARKEAEKKAATPPPAATKPVSTLPEKRNTNYTYAGDASLVPMRLFDDGQSTYLLWGEGVAFPAIYAFIDGKESLVNFGYREGFIVIEQTGPAFVLRRGELTATVYNDAWTPPALDALSPQPRPETLRKADAAASKKRTGWFGRKED